MAKPKGLPRSGGRLKGTPNKKTSDLLEVANKIGVNPFEVLCMFAANDWESLGYESPVVEKTGKDGSSYFEDRISADLRLNAAKEASKYLYPQRKAIEVSNKDDEGFKIIVEDYALKK